MKLGEYPHLFSAAALKSSLSTDIEAINDDIKSIKPIQQSLQEEIERFLSHSVLGEITSERDKISCLLRRHTQIMELLEIPQLFDTFIRNGYYEEAM